MPETIKENKMGVMPVKQLIITMSLPMMISMLVQALYNVVDSIFVSRIGESALTAVTLAFPLQNLMIALGSGTGVGINALLSRSLGEKNIKKSDAAANTGLLLTFLNFIVFLLIGLFATEPFIRSQTSDPVIIEYGTQYLSIICCFSFGIFFQMTFERLLQSTGKTIFSMASQGIGAIINIIFDPLFIFGIGPFPELGVRGAAIATILGQVIAACIGLTCNIVFNKEIHFSLGKILRPKADIIGEIYYVGVPSILMMSIGSIMTYLLNKILNGFSPTAVAVFGVYFKIQSFFFMPIFGLNNGLIPVLAYNYGAKRKKRIIEALRFSVAIALCVMLIGMVTFLAIPGLLLRMFNASEDMYSIGIAALRIICFSFPFAGLSIILSSVFQAFSKGFYSLIISIGRQLVVLIPVAWLLSMTGILDLVWLAFPIAELVSLILSACFFKKVYRETVEVL